MHALLIALAACCLGQQKHYTYRGARMAATVHTWTNGNADGDWNNVANWSSGALPGSGGAGLDDCIFDGSVTQTGPDTNMDRTADAELLRIITRSNFTGDIGGPGNPLIHDLDSTNDLSRVIHHGTGNFYGSGKVAGDLGTVVVDSTGTFYADGNIANFAVKRGTLSIASTCDCGGWLVLAGVGATVTMANFDATESHPATVVVFNGTLNNNREVENTSGGNVFILFGGTVNQAAAFRDGTSIYIGAAATFNYTRPSTGGAVSLTPVFVDGKFDLSTLNYNYGTAGFVRGQLANTLGTAVQSGYVNVTGVDLDLREEYP